MFSNLKLATSERLTLRREAHFYCFVAFPPPPFVRFLGFCIFLNLSVLAYDDHHLIPEGRFLPSQEYFEAMVRQSGFITILRGEVINTGPGRPTVAFVVVDAIR